MTKPLLSYTVTSTPSPLQTSEPGQVSIIVSNPQGGVVDLAQVLVGLSGGSGSGDISDKLSGVEPLASDGWQFEATGSGDFRATPESGQSLPVGHDGYEFVLAKIPVNNQPGKTSVAIVETTLVQGNKRVATLSKPVFKAKAPLTLEGPTADPVSVDYGGESSISWTATQGATVTLNYNGKTIDHVKGQPGTPLPASGSYLIENLIRPETVVTLNASLTSVDGPQHTTGQISVSLNAPQILGLTTSRVAGAPNTVSATWTTSSAAQTDLTIGRNPTGTVAVNGRAQQVTSILAADVTLAVTNPVASTHKSAVQPPAILNWERVADGPSLPADCLPLLFSTGSQVGLYAVSTKSDIKTYISDDAQSWRLDPKAPVNHPTPFPSVVLSTPDTTYIPVMQRAQTDYPSVKGNSISLQRRDAATGDWTTSPPISFTQNGGFYTLSIAADEAGTLYALGLFTNVPQLYTSTDKGDSWTLLDDGKSPLLAGYCFGMTTVQWFGGQLWMMGTQPNSSKVHSAVYEKGQGWKAAPITTGPLNFVNPQSVVLNDTVYLLSSLMGPQAGGTSYPLQMFKMPHGGSVSAFAHSTAATGEPPSAPSIVPTLGFTHFKGVFLVSGGPNAVKGGGIWMFNQPEF